MKGPWLIGLIALTGCDESDDVEVPVISLTSPAVSDWSEGEVTVAGTVSDDGSGLSELLINGVAVEPDADGSFSHTLSPEAGVLAVVVAATDLAGNSADVRASVIVGERLAAGESLADAMRLHVGPEVLDRIAGQLQPEHIDEPIGAEIAVLDTPCGPMSIEASWLSTSVSSVGLAPSDAGLELTIGLEDLKIALTATAPGCGFVTEGAMVDHSPTIHTVTALSVEDGVPVASPVSAEVEFSDLELYMGDVTDALLDMGLSEVVVGDAISDAVSSQLAIALAGTLSEMQFTERIVLIDHHIDLGAALSDIAISSDGISLSMDAAIAGTAEDSTGSLMLPQPDTLSPDGDIALSLPLNTLNRLMHGIWVGGGLGLEDIDIDNVLLGALFPDATDVRLSLASTLPPVVTPASADDGAMFNMDLPGVALTITGNVGKRSTTLAEGHMALSGGLNLVGSAGQGLTLQALIEGVSLDLTGDREGLTERESLETSLELLLGLMIGQDITLGNLPAPQIAEMPVGLSGAGPDGDQHWLSISATLKE